MARKPTAKAADTAKQDAVDGRRAASPWIEEIDAALKREKDWRKRGGEVVKRFRDQRASGDKRSKINILWSNTEVLKSALYARTARPDVRRRFPDSKVGNSASRFAAEAIERGIIYCADLYDVDGPIQAAIEDLLLPGRGVVRIEYDPVVLKGQPDEKGEAGEEIGEQKLQLKYVYWEDFCHGLARKWCDIPWQAFRHPMRLEEFQEKFPNQTKIPEVASTYQFEDADGNAMETSERDKFVEVWEIWDKDEKERLYAARGYRDVLQADPDPYQLEKFFPAPQPLYSITTNDSLIPEPEYCQYQDQAIELDTVTTRIRVLTNFLKWKGVYDGSVSGENQLANLSGADDGDFLPYQNWQNLKDKGGIDAAVGFWPMERIIPVLQQLHMRAPQLIQEIYEITGISDIIRGSTDPRETKGAQQLKAQFGSMRMQRRQRDVQRFIRDLYRLKAEMIAEHFTSENLADIAGFDLPSRAEQEKIKLQMQAQQLALPPSGAPPMAGAPGLLPPAPAAPGAAPDAPAPVAAQPNPPSGNVVPFMPGQPSGGVPNTPNFTAGPPMPAGAVPTLKQAPPKVDPVLAARASGPSWDDVMEILRSDKLRGYRVDIETDSTILEDAQQQKQDRLEFATAFNDALEKAYLAAVQAPMMLPLIKEEVLFIVRTFKAGRSMEQNVEDAFQQLMEKPPAPPDKGQKAGPDPAIEAAKAKIAQDKNLIDAKKAEADAVHNAGMLAIERDKAIADAKHKSDALALERDKIAADQRLKAAAHNKTLVDEALTAADGAAGVAQGQAQPNVLQAMLGSVEQLAAAIAAGQAQQGQEIAALTRAMTAPKRIVRGADGRAAGVEPVLQ